MARDRARPTTYEKERLPALSRPSLNFKAIFEKALKAYNKKINQDLTAHPLATQLQPCDSPATILTILQEQVDQFKRSQGADERLQKWLNPTINVLYAFSQTLGEGIGLVNTNSSAGDLALIPIRQVFSPALAPAKVIFAGAGVLLLAAKEVEASQDIIIDIFERIENFFRRLEVYIEVPPTPAMADMMVKIMVEMLDILGTATKEMKQSRARKFLKKVAGISKLEDGLKKLDKMTNEEARMANAEVLKIPHDINKKVEGVDENIKVLDEKCKQSSTQVINIITNFEPYRRKGSSDGSTIGHGNNLNVAQRRRHKAFVINPVIVDGRASYTLTGMQLLKSLREPEWQSPSDPSINHVIASDRQHEGTTEWFCKGITFEEWKTSGSLLWVHGKPGSGKSILCSAIINDIEMLHKAGLASMAYFYFDFRDIAKQSRRDLLRSLLIQLSDCSDQFCDILSRLYEAYGKGTRQPSDGALTRCLKEMLTLPNRCPVYLIMDALDECPNTLEFHPLVNSRPEVDIRYALERLPLCSVSLHNESGQEKDIIEYVKAVVYSPSNTLMKRWRDEDKDMVNVPHVLRQLPATLDETYARVLKEIGKTNQFYAHRLLQCLTVAKRPLRVDELAEILALDFTAEEGIPELKENWRWKDEEEAVLSTCSSLISVVGPSFHRVVQFSHFSVKEFLTSDRLFTSSADISYFHILSEPAHTITVEACLGVLLRSQNGASDADTGNGSPLTIYAAQHWVDHIRCAKVWPRIEDAIQPTSRSLAQVTGF
ncbi:hypothetical protein EDB89DRAFT_1908396 [Lactarius sanguifluus]|nr:hypothetical protein EDB89DRAFT_1908396 [Lactarius sanguifluus]